MNMRAQRARIKGYFPLLVLAAIFFFIFRAPHAVAPGFPAVTIGGVTVSVEVASTKAERGRGLSGRDMLTEGSGMLFIFDRPERYGFWMPDMHFAIDIVWIGPDWRIVDIAENVTPESYPTVFKPNAPAQYVLEVPAGTTEHYHFKAGDEVDWRPKE